MYPIYDYEGIKNIEKQIDGKHVICFLIVRPDNYNASEYLDSFNYWHQLSDEYLSIYAIGYSKDFMGKYKDVKTVASVDGEDWQYSDKCFITVRKELNKRLKNWRYSSSPELIILQSSNSGDGLDFTNYVYLDLEVGIKKGYIDSVQRFMERFIEACEKEVTATEAIRREERYKINGKRLVQRAIELFMPEKVSFVSDIIGDRLFFKTSRTKEQ